MPPNAAMPQGGPGGAMPPGVPGTNLPPGAALPLGGLPPGVTSTPPLASTQPAAKVSPKDKRAAAKPAGARGKKVSANNTPIPAAATTPSAGPGKASPSGVPTYSATGPNLAPDQLKMPATRKRKSSAGLDDKRSPMPPAKKEKLEEAKVRETSEIAAKKEQLQRENPLGFFISSLGEALDVPAEEIAAFGGVSFKVGGNNPSALVAGNPGVVAAAANGAATNGTPGPAAGPAVAAATAAAAGFTPGTAAAAAGAGAGAGAGSGLGLTPSSLLKTPMPFDKGTAASTGDLAASSNSLASSSSSSGEAVAAAVPWTGLVSAASLKSAFQALECFKVSEVQFLTPPEEHSKLPKGKEVKTEDPAEDDKAPVPELNGAQLFPSGDNMWDFDSIANGVSQEDLDKEFWTFEM